MKLLNHIKALSGVFALSLGTMVTSCNFLDIVPPEQATLYDATKDADATLGFLSSCYAGITNPILTGGTESAGDEYVNPPLWQNNGQRIAYDQSNQNAPADERWTKTWKYIGQTLLFLQELPKARGITELERVEWTAEAYFLLAYYHAEILRFYGPCPITDKLLGINTTPDMYGGRWHYDAAVDWIVDTIDEKVLAGHPLPDKRNTNETGRITHVIASAFKARVLLYAASPLWNGNFPFPTWKSKVETEYKGKNYGKELVSTTPDENKWRRALTACQEALEAAQGAGYCLYGLNPDGTPNEDILSRYETDNIKLENVYIPGENITDEFKKTVLMLRYLVTARANDGNTELIWGVNKDDDSFITTSMPKRVLKQNNGDYVNGWSGIAPTLNSIERFYMADGTRLQNPSDSELFKRANVDPNRPDIIKMNVAREARFYAWMAFDHGDWSTQYANTKPLKLDIKNSAAHGYDPQNFNRDNNVTGYFNQKFLSPGHVRTVTGSQSWKRGPRPIIRMAELYLSIAECYAALNDIDNAIKYLAPVRKRAGLPELTRQTINDSGYDIMEWVRNERFCELWGEGHRLHDVHRWAKGPEYLGAGKRRGLNALVVDPSFETFNTPMAINQPFTWNDRMYLAPLGFEESSKNLNLVQAPGY